MDKEFSSINMQLSPEDSLRLNVLLAQKLHAVRIDQSKNIVYAITEKGEAKIQLSPTCADSMYIKLVKELFSTKILGTPGGYPVFLKRWTRMGQANDSSLENLLKLGEPEAVTAVIHAPGLTAELAQRAWWCEQSTVNARTMLQRKTVASSEFGKELAHFLLEFLSYEARQRDIIESINVVLQPGLITQEQKLALWQKGKRKNTFYVGFLFGAAHDLPEQHPEHPKFLYMQSKLSHLVSTPCSEKLLFLLSDKGQSWLKTVVTVINKPINQDVVFAVLESIRHLLKDIAPDEVKRRNIKELKIFDTKPINTEASSHFNKLYDTLSKADHHYVDNLLFLSMVSEQIALPILATSEAIGTVMRKQIKPVTEPVLSAINVFFNKN